MEKLYVLVKQDLSGPQKAVQASHAVAEFMSSHGKDENVQRWVKDHKTMVLLDVDDPQEYYVGDRLCMGLSAPFREPDMDNTMTAAAFLPEDGNIFRDLQLMKC